MQTLLAESIGTMLLVLLGDGVVANVVLKRTKGQNCGWIVITVGWGVAVAMAVYAVGRISGAHLNPAVTIGAGRDRQLPVGGRARLYRGADDRRVPRRRARLAGVPAALARHRRPGAKLGGVLHRPGDPRARPPTSSPRSSAPRCCCSGSSRSPPTRRRCRRPGDVDLSFVFSRGLQPLLVGVLVLGIGLSLGGPTGYAINPARDLGPRLAHAMLPIPGKGDSDWAYAWIPVVGPMVGGVLGAGLYSWSVLNVRSGCRDSLRWRSASRERALGPDGELGSGKRELIR